MSDPLIAVDFSEKGGVGKTSVTTGIAAVAAEEGMNVLVIDGDPRGTATDELGIPEEALSEILTLNDLLKIPLDRDPTDPADVIHQVIHQARGTWPANVRIIPAERNLANRETDSSPIEGRLARGLSALTDVDLIICDTPPRAGGKLVSALLHGAHTVLHPATLTTDGLLGVQHAKRTMKLMKMGPNPGLRCSGVVRNAVPSSKRDVKQIHREFDRLLHEHFPGEVLDIQLKWYAIREEARMACVPITKAPGREAKLLVEGYKALLDHLLSGKDMTRG